MKRILQPVKIKNQDNSITWGMSEAFKALRRLQNIRFVVKHRGDSVAPKEYKVKRFVFEQKYGEQGGCAKAVSFERKMPDGEPKRITVFDYYMQQYQARLQHWALPLIETLRGEYFPMEVCEVRRFNSYPYKLDPQQVCPPGDCYYRRCEQQLTRRK